MITEIGERRDSQFLTTELEKLNQREEFIRTKCIREVLIEYRRYPAERHCPVEIMRKLNTNIEYLFILERKQRLRSELAMISKEG